MAARYSLLDLGALGSQKAAMGMLLKFAVFAVAGYVAWTAARRLLGLGSALGRRATETVERGPAAKPRQPVVEDTRACPVCGVFVAASAAGCGRAGCPQA
jgi:hypothetical protein